MNWDLYGLKVDPGFDFGPVIAVLAKGIWCEDMDELKRKVQSHFADDFIGSYPVILAADPRNLHVIAFNR